VVRHPDAGLEGGGAMTEPPIMETIPGGYRCSFPEGTTLEALGVECDRYGRLFATVAAFQGEHLLHRARINLLDQGAQRDFHKGASIRNGHIDWRARLLALQQGLLEDERQHVDATGGGTADQGGTGEAAKADEGNPWGHIKDAPTFISEPQPEFEGLAKEVLAPGAITILSAPRGLGKTHIGYDLGVSLATRGTFRGAPVRPVRVLLLDRDNPEYLIRQRLKAWGAAASAHLHVLTRQHAPSLRDRKAWAHFPVEDYQVLIIDAVGSFTEGITEKEGRATTEVLATLVDLARKDLAILLLQNATKDGMSFKGWEEWADRADIIYELRDATDFTPSLKKPWWEELPQAHEGAWAARAARRKGRCDFRLAFTPSKYRLGLEPEPFCLGLRLLPDVSWTVDDVTEQLEQAGAKVKAQAEQTEIQQRDQAAQVLAELVAKRAAAGDPVRKTEVETFLCREKGLKRQDARQFIDIKNGVLWTIVPLPHTRGNPELLMPVQERSLIPSNDGGNTGDWEAAPDKDSQAPIAAGLSPQGWQKYPPASPRGTRASDHGYFRQDEGVFQKHASEEGHNGHYPTDIGTEEFDL
jgi:hypothetical protein